jgi:flagellar biogenesis protein FliO
MMIAILGAAAMAAAQEPPASTATSQTAASSPLESKPLAHGDHGIAAGDLWSWVRPLAALAIVVAVILLLRAVLKRLGRTGRIALGGQVVQVLVRSRLSSRCELCLVRWGKRLLLIGLGPTGPVALGEMSDPQEASAVLAELELKKPAGAASGGAVRDTAERIRARLSSDERLRG